MAFIDKGWFLDTEWVDTAGNKTSRTFQLVATDDAGDLTAVIADVQTIVAAYIAASDCHLASQRLGKLSVEDSLSLPAATVKVSDNLQVSAKIFGTPNKSAVFEIPGPKVSLFQATTGEGFDQPDFAVTALANVVNLYKDGHQVLISDGESITDVGIRGRRVSHKSRKG